MVGNGRAEGSSAIGDRGHAAVSLTPDVDRTHICSCGSSQLVDTDVGGLLYVVWVHIILQFLEVLLCLKTNFMIKKFL